MSFERLFQATLAKLGVKIAPLVYLAHHAGRVLSLRSDGRADVTADDPEIDGESGLAPLQVLAGMPGARFDFSAGDRVRFGAEGGSPAGQEVRLFEQDRSAEKALARKTDKVRVSVAFLTSSLPKTPLISPGASAIGIVPVLDGIPRLDLMISVKPGEDDPAAPPGTIPPPPHIQTIETDGTIITGSSEIFIR